jgi:hypothetical protein
MLTILNADDPKVKAVKVRIIADTVVTRDGRGVLLYTGSVLNVRPHEANDLFASIKAVRAKDDEPEVLTKYTAPAVIGSAPADKITPEDMRVVRSLIKAVSLMDEAEDFPKSNQLQKAGSK